jgi:hypothetical protein
MRPRILNIRKVPFRRWAHGAAYEAKIAWVGSALGSRKLGFEMSRAPKQLEEGRHDQR